MKWKDIIKGHKFKDNSTVIQRHQIHMYDCYQMSYEDDNGKVRTLVASKDHLLQINISNWPKDAQEEVRKYCVGKIPLKEDIQIEVLGYVTKEQAEEISKYISGESNGSYFKSVEEISEPNVECYLFDVGDTFTKEVFIKRFTLEDELQKIDENNYWIPMEGLFYLFKKYGELTI